MFLEIISTIEIGVVHEAGGDRVHHLTNTRVDICQPYFLVGERWIHRSSTLMVSRPGSD